MGCTEKYAADKSYDDMLHTVRALTVQNFSKLES